ncbi:MAG: hypothetical protein WAM69_00735 [Candidatus Sulfotelmatobacter sp.]
MSANVDVLRSPERMRAPAQETIPPQVEIFCATNDWNPEDFAREQIRGLVHRVFFAGGDRPVKQVVFSAAEPHTSVADICDQVGWALALETSAHIAIVDCKQRMAETVRAHTGYKGSAAIKSWSTQIAINLWRVPELALRECGEESGTGRYWLSCLAELRNEFGYAVIHGPAAGISSEAALLGQLADGIILVVGARSTRKATARKIKQTLEAAQSRILGTVLSDRTFPVPEQIYRRL